MSWYGNLFVPQKDCLSVSVSFGGGFFSLFILYSWCLTFLFLLYVVYHIFHILKQVDGMDAFAVKQACKFAKEHALKNGPIVSKFSAFLLVYVCIL